MKIKKRLDVLLVEQGYAETRTKAQAVIMSGNVYVDGQKADKPGVSYEEHVAIEDRGASCPYVSRGGLKLEKALRDFGVDPTGYVCSDSGASTGGFTDCLLQKGAKKVFAIDVGYGQLDWKIRSDPRVVVMERTNVRYVTPEQLGEPLDLSVVDVSFISLRIVLPVIKSFLKPESGQILCLIKPQFEAGKEKVGKKGVVRDPAVHKEVLDDFLALTQTHPWEVRFIELMPMGPCAEWDSSRFLPVSRILEQHPELQPIAPSGVARRFRLPDAAGTVGLISPVSHSFCADCRRIRITADGKLKGCLHSREEVSLKGLRGEALEAAIRQGILQKPLRHHLQERSSDTPRTMNQIGG